MKKTCLIALFCISIIAGGASMLDVSQYPPGTWRKQACEVPRIALEKGIPKWLIRHIQEYLIPGQTTITFRNCDCEKGLQLTCQDISLGKPGLLVGKTILYPDPISMELCNGINKEEKWPSTQKLKIPIVPLKINVKWTESHHTEENYSFEFSVAELCFIKIIEVNQQAIWIKNNKGDSIPRPVIYHNAIPQ